MKTRANAVIGDNRTRYACIPGNRSHYTEIFFRYGVTKRDFFQLLLSSLLLLLSFQFFTSFKIQRRGVFFSRNSWIGGLAKYAEYRSFDVQLGTTRAVSRNNDNDNETPTSPTFDVRTIYVLGLRNGERGSRRPLENGVI